MKKLIFAIMVLSLTTILHCNDYNPERKWWQDAVFYEIFVRSFYDSDGNGVGDLRGLIQKLDYLNDGNPETQTDLGIDALWLMPIFSCNSYHGYDIENYYAINSEYGTMEDFEKLIEEAHKRGIRIILDLVINHSSVLHEWFLRSQNREKPYDDFYVWTNREPKGWKHTWNYNSTRNEWYYAAFWRGMPDLNHNSKALFEEIKKITEFWLSKGVDGFRLDAARHMIEEGPKELESDTLSTIKWWKKYNAFVKELNPDALLIGEVWSGNRFVHLYYNKGEGLDMCFDFDYSDRVLLAGSYGNIDGLRRSHIERETYPAPNSFYAPFLANHDKIRAMNIIMTNFDRAKMMAVMLLTSSGTPFIYYGEEIGMYQKEGRDDILKRTPMQWDDAPNAGFTTRRHPWTAVVTRYPPFTVSYQEKFEGSLLTLYKKLIRIRKENPEFRSLSMRYLDTVSKQVAFYRRSDDEGNSSIVLVSGSKTNIRYENSYFKDKTFMDLLDGKLMEFKDSSIDLPPFGYRIFKEIRK